MPIKEDVWEQRHEAIREILDKELVRSQGELASRLRRRGFVVTQPSISRDLRELHAVKVDGRYVLRDTLVSDNGEAGPKDVLADIATSILRVVAAGPNLLVMHTPPGRAPAVSAAIDSSGWTEVIGTLAGDDAIFIAIAGRREQAIIEGRLARIVKGMSNG